MDKNMQTFYIQTKRGCVKNKQTNKKKGDWDYDAPPGSIKILSCDILKGSITVW